MAALMVLQKPMLAVYPPATLTAWYYAVGSVLTLAVCAFFGVRPVDFLLTGQWEVGVWVFAVWLVCGGVCESMGWVERVLGLDVFVCAVCVSSRRY